MSDFTDLQDAVQALEDNADQAATDTSDAVDQLNSDISDVSERTGQLEFPLSQDSIDLITEQAPAIIGTYVQQGYAGTIVLSAGTATLINPNITTTSVIVFNLTNPSGIPQIPAVGLPVNHLYYWVVITAGQAVFHSSLTGDASTLNYIIF